MVAHERIELHRRLSHSQIDLSDLIRRFRIDSQPRVFGSLCLSEGAHYDNHEQKLLLSLKGKTQSVVLTPSEYVILWALIAVSRSHQAEGGYLTTRELDNVLTGIMRESRVSTVGKKNAMMSSSAPLKMREDADGDDVEIRTHDTVHQFVKKINNKMRDAFGGVVVIESDHKRGYYLRTFGTNHD